MTSTAAGSARRPHSSTRPTTRSAAATARVKPAQGTPSTPAVQGTPSVRAVKLPRRWVDSVLPAELPVMAREIIRRVRAEIPEYRRAMDGPYGRSIRQGTEKALVGFMTQFFRTGELSPESEEFFRGLGRGEAIEGRPHDVLLGAYRAGALVAWHRIVSACEREPLPADVVGHLAELIFGFADRLARLSSEGYAAAQNEDAGVTARLRARLARMIISQPGAPAEAVHELAGQLVWTVPDQVVVLDVRVDDLQAAAAATVLSMLSEDALIEQGQSGPVVVMPAPVDARVLAEVVALVPGMQVSVGCTLPFADAAQSLRWARLASRLRDERILPQADVLLCDDHVPALLLQADPAIADLLVRRRLAPLLELPDPRRLKFARLLSAWLEYGGSQAELAEAMGTHRQTLHYRIGRLQAMFGEQLHDADARVEIVLALRAVLPRWELAAVAD